jgi:hypothetical protein
MAPSAIYARMPAAMATPAPTRVEIEDDVPLIDPWAVPLAVRRERARRHARVEHSIEQKRARVRFWALLLTLLFFTVILSLTILDQIQALFGL